MHAMMPAASENPLHSHVGAGLTCVPKRRMRRASGKSKLRWTDLTMMRSASDFEKQCAEVHRLPLLMDLCPQDPILKSIAQRQINNA